MSKERLEEIEKSFNFWVNEDESIGILPEDIEWIIQQAKLGISQQEQFHDYKTENLSLQKRVQELENHLKLYEFWYRTAYEQNKRYREALELLVKQETIGNDVKTGKTAISYNGMIALKGLGVFNDDNYIVYGLDEIIESVLEESK